MAIGTGWLASGNEPITSMPWSSLLRGIVWRPSFRPGSHTPLTSLCKETARKSPLWLDEYFDRVLRSEMELTEKLEYIHDHPWRRWPELKAYRWVWLAGLQDAED